MLASYGPIARRSAAITAGAALIMIVLSTVLGGAKGLLGSVLGTALVAAFFAAMNVVGGYSLTDRMLQMFRKKPTAPKADATSEAAK